VISNLILKKKTSDHACDDIENISPMSYHFVIKNGHFVFNFLNSSLLS
jgi:hypothetical protein